MDAGSDGAADEAGVMGDDVIDNDADAGDGNAGANDEGTELCDGGVVE
jgi:hypothetical protein